MRTYKVAIIGSTGRGNYGHGLDVVWKSHPKCEVVAVADDDPAGLAAAIPRTGAVRGYADYREMLDKERPAIVAVAPRWIDQHHAMAMACAEYSCHIYMEKPFCRSLKEADEIVRACEMRHLKVAVAHVSRYSPQLDIIHKLLANGEIGELVEVRGRGKEDARGGGEDLWVLGSHVLDLMSCFAGKPRQCFASLLESDQPVTAQMLRPGNEGLGPLAGTQISAMFQFTDGITGFFASRRNAGGTPSKFGVRLLGTKGIIDLPSGYGNPAYLLQDPGWCTAGSANQWRTISSRGLDQPETLEAMGYDGANPVVLNDLIECIEQDRLPKCSMYEGRGAVEMILSILASHRAGGPVDMPLASGDHPFADWL